MSLIIQRQDGTTYNTADYGLRLIDFIPSSPAYNTVYEEIEGRDGAIDTGTTIGVRKLPAEFDVVSRDKNHFVLLRNLIFQLFHSKESFFVIDEREPGKRWFAKVDPYTLDEVKQVKAKLQLVFNAARPFAESFGTTQDDYTFESELWGIGMNLPTDQDLIYTFDTPTFGVFNAGDVTVDPRDIEMYMKVVFKGASSNLTIRNTTTGDEWNCTETTVAGDTITLDDVRSFKNGSSIFKSTNRKPITLQPGWNDFEIIGALGAFSISFDFRFYYL
ncbi:phage tail family protein [Bacillus sp. OTU530]|uniref:phage tail family protein n=1 Tax=Bacillus sp. OTU530 TaxID=3043862 RepID=UPI00313EB076